MKKIKNIIKNTVTLLLQGRREKYKVEPSIRMANSHGYLFWFKLRDEVGNTHQYVHHTKSGGLYINKNNNNRVRPTKNK